MRTANRCAMRLDHVLTWCKDRDTGPAGATALLADIRHWCDVTGESFARLDRMAYEMDLADRTGTDFDTDLARARMHHAFETGAADPDDSTHSNPNERTRP